MTSLSLPSSPSRGGGGKPPMSPALSSSLPKLTSESELQKLLADERMRSQMHRTNYEQLKEEHRRLQEEFAQLEDEIKKTVEESKIVQEKYKSMYEDARREVSEKSLQMEEFRSKTITPQKLEIIRTQVQGDLDKVYKERFTKQELEIEEYRTMCNKLKIELSFTKSEYEHERLEYQRVLEEVKLSAEAEVTNLRKERETTIAKVKAECSQDAERVRVLQKENAHVLLKLKTVTTEVEDLRAQRDKSEFDHDNITRVQAKQLTEYSANVKGLETERESLKRQVEQLHRDLAGTGDTHNKLTSRIHELERDNVQLKNRVDEALHKNKVDMTNLKMDMLKQRGDLERERDKLANQLEDMQTKLEISKHTVDQQNRSLAEKEREAVRRVQAAREEEFVKVAKIEEEKLALETKIQENERRKIDHEAHKHAEKEKMEDRIRAMNEAKESAERELLVLKTKIDHHESLRDHLDRERSENSELKSKVTRLENEISSYLGSEHDMTDENLRLRNQVELLKEEVKLTKNQLKKIQDNHDIILVQQKSSYKDEKNELDKRVHELNQRLDDVQKKYQKALMVYKKYKKKSLHVVGNLKDKLELLEAKNQEVELEKKALQSCVPQDTYSKLKKQWKDLQRRHGEFRKYLLASVAPVPIGDMSFASVTMPADCTFLPANISYELERKHQRELQLLRERLDKVDSNQQQQLEELQEIAHSTFRGTFPDLDEKVGDTISDKGIENKLEESKEKADIEKSS